MIKTILTIAVALLSANALLSKEQYIYRQISHNEGLTSTVNSIYKEKDGDVWIGTPNGLFSFNGYSLKNHSHELQGVRRVFQVKPDLHDNLWVLTNRHVFMLENGTDTLKRISQKEDAYFCMACDEEGIWIGSMTCIYRWDADGFRACFKTPSGIECRSICKLDQATLLCCSHSGKILIDIATGKISEAPYGDNNEVYAAYIDRRGHIWFALYNSGIEVYEKDGTKIKSYNTSNSALSNNLVLCLAERDSLILAGTDGGGINIIDPEHDTIRTLSHISGDRSSFPAHSIKSLHVDHYGNIWAGSVRDGLISIKRSDINTYQDTHLGLNNGLSNPSVLCLHQDWPDGDIWIGTDGEGLNRFEPQTAEFFHYRNTFKTKVVSIADFTDKELAVSTYADNVWIFSKRDGTLRPLPLADSRFRHWIKHSGRSVNLYNEADGDLLLFANSVHRYDRKSGLCKSIAIEGSSMSYSNFLILGRTDEGVWMHNSNNIYLLHDDADTLTLKGTHKNGDIRNGHIADDGMIWLATEEGLCCYNTADGTLRHIPSTIFTDANSVICDKSSRVWVGTENALSAYLPESGSFTLFGESDGAMPNEYLPKPHLLADNGDVYFGGVQGLVHIRAGHAIDTTEVPALKLSELTVDDAIMKPDSESGVRVPRNSKAMSISVAVQEKDMFRQRAYRFAFSDDKVYQTDIPVLSLHQLPDPGTYGVTVSCTRRNGEWTEPVRLMTLHVPQPWYLSWWFICSCLALLALIFSTALYSISKRKANELKIAIQDREQKIYEEKVQMLINISHELRTPLTLIMAPLKRLLKDTSEDLENFQVLSRIYRQSRRMRGLLDMVLDLRKMEVGGNRLKRTDMDFNRWLADSVDDIVNEEKAEGIEVTCDPDPAIGVVGFDVQKCDTVLMNILMNAIKHSSAGDTITIRTSLTDEGMVRTSISDQGPGLGADIDPSKMFTRFYQSNSEKYGSGIGLSYSRILVEMHGGHIGAYNNPDRGATFWWEIPAVCENGSNESESRAYLNELLGHFSEADIIVPSGDGFSTSGMRLMIVDDNTDLLDFLREALCQDFAEVITATGGNPALKVLAGGKLPDIIVSDVNMPDGDGFWLCNQLKKNEKYSHIPVVLLTARGEDQSQSESYRLGADGFLAKPFETETLMELLRGLLRNKSEIRKRYLDEDSIAEADYGSNEERFILQLNKIIAEHLSDPDLDQQLICMELGVSRALLYNRMKAITGAGAKEYITRIRIEKAKSLIETTSLTIAEISDMTGFASQSYFSTAFKNYTGMTPSKYKTASHKKD